MPRAALLMGPLALLLFLGAFAALPAQHLSTKAIPGFLPLETFPKGENHAPANLAARSLLLPGWGQITQGQRRGLVYGLAEAALWFLWFDRRSAAGDLRTAYRDLAWQTARGSVGPRQEGAWDYYEAMSKWERSGAYDRDLAAPGLQPEEDPSTHNGSIWALARDLHFRGGNSAPGDPSYQAALSWYEGRAYGEPFLWDWSGREGAKDEYVRLIHRSDQRFSQATSALGAVLANHLLSGADAFLSARISGVAQMRVAPRPRSRGSALDFMFSWRPPS